MTRAIDVMRASVRHVGVAMAVAASIFGGTRVSAQTTGTQTPPSSAHGLGADTATIIDLATAESQVQAEWARGNMMGNDRLRAEMADLERIHRYAYRYAGTASDEHGTAHVLLGLTSPTTPTFTGYLVILGAGRGANAGGPLTGATAADGCHMTATIDKPATTITLTGPCSGSELTGAMVFQTKKHRQAAEYNLPRDQ